MYCTYTQLVKGLLSFLPTYEKAFLITLCLYLCVCIMHYSEVKMAKFWEGAAGGLMSTHLDIQRRLFFFHLKMKMDRKGLNPANFASSLAGQRCCHNRLEEVVWDWDFYQSHRLEIHDGFQMTKIMSKLNKIQRWKVSIFFLLCDFEVLYLNGQLEVVRGSCWLCLQCRSSWHAKWSCNHKIYCF